MYWLTCNIKVSMAAPPDSSARQRRINKSSDEHRDVSGERGCSQQRRVLPCRRQLGVSNTGVIDQIMELGYAPSARFHQRLLGST
jgi:hypothetical protein